MKDEPPGLCSIKWSLGLGWNGETIVSMGSPCCCKHPFREKLAEKEAERCGSGGDASTSVGVNTVACCSFKVLKKKPFWLKPSVFFSLTSSFSNGPGIDRLIRQKKLAETQKLETMYSTLFEKFNNEETVFEEKLECDFNQLNKQTHLLSTSGSVDFECSSPSFLLVDFARTSSGRSWWMWCKPLQAQQLSTLASRSQEKRRVFTWCWRGTLRFAELFFWGDLDSQKMQLRGWFGVCP